MLLSATQHSNSAYELVPLLIIVLLFVFVARHKRR